MEWPVAVIRSDRTSSVLDGNPQPSSIAVRWHALPAGEIFTRMLREANFGACEMSFSYALMALERGVAPFVLLPVFLWRSFRQGFIYVRTDGPVRTPADLEGRTFGLPDFYATDPLWIRGMLQDVYAVDTRRIRWLQFRDEKRLELSPPPGFDVRTHLTNDPEALLRGGEVDAFFSPGPVAAFQRGEPWIRRLFPEPKQEDLRYYRATSVFPIMHTFVVHRDLYAQHPRVAVELYDLLVASRDDWYRQLDSPWSVSGLPWFRDTVQETRDVLGDDFWPYGVASNRRALETAVRYSLRDGLIARPFAPEELFVPELRDT